MGRTSRGGFTLIEILVVLGIIGILAAFLLPVFGRARENGRRSVCLSNLYQIGLATQQYVDDYDHQYPRAVSPTDQLIPDSFSLPVPPYYPSLLTPYTKSGELLHCPSDGGWWKIKPQSNFVVYGTSYDYNYNIWADAVTHAALFSAPSRVILFMDSEDFWHSGHEEDTSRNDGYYQIVCADLHIKRIPRSQWIFSADSYF